MLWIKVFFFFFSFFSFKILVASEGLYYSLHIFMLYNDNQLHHLHTYILIYCNTQTHLGVSDSFHWV